MEATLESAILRLTENTSLFNEEAPVTPKKEKSTTTCTVKKNLNYSDIVRRSPRKQVEIVDIKEGK